GKIKNIEPGFEEHMDYEIDEITNGLESDYSEERNDRINEADDREIDDEADDREIDDKAYDRNNEIDNEMDDEAEFEDDEVEFEDKIDEIDEIDKIYI
ncbi:16620_t:CDS:1, partial [Racocetra persica]